MGLNAKSESHWSFNSRNTVEGKKSPLLDRYTYEDVIEDHLEWIVYL